MRIINEYECRKHGNDCLITTNVFIVQSEETDCMYTVTKSTLFQIYGGWYDSRSESCVCTTEEDAQRVFNEYISEESLKVE